MRRKRYAPLESGGIGEAQGAEVALTWRALVDVAIISVWPRRPRLKSMRHCVAVGIIRAREINTNM